MQKVKSYRNRAYIDWVKTLPCCHTGEYGVDAHHVMIAHHGMMGTKAPDFAAVPLKREIHDMVTKAPHLWPQMKWLIDTQNRAFHEGIFR